MKAPEIFNKAVQITKEAERSAYVESACDGDTKLRDEILQLIGLHFSDSRLRFSGEDEPSDVLLGTTLDEYRILEVIGEGGFGKVYRAEQTGPLRREVAVKVLRPERNTQQLVSRFEIERQALATMSHPSVAQVYGGGTTPTGVPYVCMELVRGLPIVEYCNECNLSLPDRLELFNQVCRAVQHAHTKGVIHRDLKPSNILITLQDGEPAPKVIDFGIAKIIDTEDKARLSLTGFHQIVGTPQYMSPEQVSFSTNDVDTRSDVYSLGVILYELLSNRTPIEREAGKSLPLDELCRLIREVEPPTPSSQLSDSSKRSTANAEELRRKMRTIRGELDWITTKAIAKKPAERYQSPAALAEDIDRFLNAEPVVARQPSLAYLTRKFIQRNRSPAVAVGFSLLALAMAGLIAAAGLFRAASESEKRRILLYAANMNVAWEAWHQGNVAEAERLLDLHSPANSPKDERNFEWHCLQHLCKANRTTYQHSGRVKAVAFSPDGKDVAFTGWEGEVVVWNQSTGKVTELPSLHKGLVETVAYSSNDSAFATAGHDGQMVVWNTKSHEPVLIRDDFRRGTGMLGRNAVAFSPDDTKIAYATEDRLVRVIELGARKEVLSLELADRSPSINYVEVSGRHLLIAGTFDERNVTVWDATTGGLVQTDERAFGLLMAVSNDGKFAASTDQKRVVVRELTQDGVGDVVAKFDLPGEYMTFSPNGSLLAIAGLDNLIRIVDCNSWTIRQTLRGHSGIVWWLSFSPDGRRLASASSDMTVQVWDVAAVLAESIVHTDQISRAAITLDGKSVAVIGGNKANVYDTSSGAVEFERDEQTQAYLRFVDNHELVMNSGDDRESCLLAWRFDGPNEDELERINLGQNVQCIDVRGETLVSGYRNGVVSIWDRTTSTEKHRFFAKAETAPGTLDTNGDIAEEDYAVWGIALSQDGELCAVSGQDSVTLFNANGKPTAGPFALHAPLSRWCEPLAISNDKAILAVGCEDNSVELWDIASGLRADILRGHPGNVKDLEFSPDNMRLVSIGNNGTVRIWDVSHGLQVAVIRQHEFVGRSVAFTADGSTLLTSSYCGLIRLWHTK